MVRSGFFEHFVGWCHEVLILRYFLEVGFRVDVKRFLEDFRESGIDVFLYKSFCFIVAEIEVERAEKGLEGIGDDIGISVPPSKKLPLGDEDIILKTEFESDGGEVLSANERAPDVGEFSFRLRRIRMEEDFGRDELQNSIPEELETFVAFCHMDDIFI